MKGIPETVVYRILMFMWSLGPYSYLSTGSYVTNSFLVTTYLLPRDYSILPRGPAIYT